MKIVIAPQVFKGCASAQIIAATIAAGVHRAFPQAHLVLAPVADGGDDTLEILLAAKSGERHYSQITGALKEFKWIHWGALTNAFPKTVIIELARVCGLATLEIDKRNPLITTTYGIGELINIALEKGYKKLFIGLGGSSTNDAGVGLAQALGVRFLDSHGKELPKGGGALIHLKNIDMSKINPLIKGAEFIAGCDVTNPLIGPTGASQIFSEQKGASHEMKDLLEKSLENFANVVKKEFGQDLTTLPYLGAAGGTAASLHLFCHAQLVSGAKWILNEMNFNQFLENADLVITGEGCLDLQTTFQKAPLIVAEAAKKHSIPIILISGMIKDSEEIAKKKIFDKIIAVSSHRHDIPLNALKLLEKTAEKAVINFFAEPLQRNENF